MRDIKAYADKAKDIITERRELTFGEIQALKAQFDEIGGAQDIFDFICDTFYFGFYVGYLQREGVKYDRL